MNNVNVSSLLGFAIFASTAWFLYSNLYKKYVEDSFRQKMFILRDELFDDAANGLIDFEHPAYCTLRRTMNGCLRFSHKINIVEFFMLFLLLKNDQTMKNAEYSFAKKMNESTKNLEKDVKEKLENYRIRMSKLIVVHMIRISPLFVVLSALTLICLIVPVIVCALLHKQVKVITDSILSQNLEKFETAAMAIGS